MILETCVHGETGLILLTETIHVKYVSHIPLEGGGNIVRTTISLMVLLTFKQNDCYNCSKTNF